MPISDPRAGRAFIWLVASLLLLSLLAGGGCLAVYMILPPTDATSLLPVAGVALVALPWSFWFLTILYRIVSRVFFSRVSPAGGERGRVGPAVGAQSTAVESAGVDGGNNMNLDEATAVNDEERKDGYRKKDRRRSNSSSSSNGSSESHESEMALVISMVS